MTKENLLGQRIKQIVEAQGIGQNGLADAIGANRSVVSRWIRGYSKPTKTSLLRIAIATGCSPDWLLTGEGPTGISEQNPTQLDADLLEKFINILDGLEWVLEKRGREMDFERKKGWLRYLYKQLRQENTAEITRDKVEGVIVEVDELNKTREVTI